MMKAFKAARALIVLACFCFTPIHTQAAQQFSASEAMQSVAENFVRPAYLELEEAAEVLSAHIQALCAKPSIETLTLARDSFSKTATAWGRIEFFRAGPVLSENRLERMLFFPDRKGTGLKQIQALLADQTSDLPNATALAGSSVAVQGLGALDYVLAGDGATDLITGAPRRCAIGSAVAANIMAISATLKSEWAAGGTADQFMGAPGAQNPLARSDLEATNFLLGTIIHGLEAVRDMRLMVLFGKEGAPDKPKSALMWRSGLTMKIVIANLEGARELFESSNLAAALPSDQANMASMVRFSFKQSIKTAKDLDSPILDSPIEEILKNDLRREKLKYLALSIQQLVNHLDREFAPAAGLAAGFSFGDGD